MESGDVLRIPSPASCWLCTPRCAPGMLGLPHPAAGPIFPGIARHTHPRNKRNKTRWGFPSGSVSLESGDVLSSRAVASRVLSALRGLTAVFGMGTGGTLSP